MYKDSIPHLIVMLTKDDYTVENAIEIFESCKHTSAKFWGFKEKPLSMDKMKTLVSKMKEFGKTPFMEIVSYTEEEGIESAKIAAECGVEVIMGTKFYPSILRYCLQRGIKYMPFVGIVEGRPSVLTGEISDILREATEVITAGAFGIDLLGYRHVDDPVRLNNKLVTELHAPVCIAGSIDSYERLDEIKKTKPWAFTIGSAFFDNKFNGSFAEQINKVCEYMSLPF